MNAERWKLLMDWMGLPPSPETYEALAGAYSEPHRHYHTMTHIRECLEELDGARFLARSAGEVEVALWFHDAVYRTRSARNEAESAAWATRFLEGAGADPDRCARVHDLIMATVHDTEVCDGDPALVVDVDLAILGQGEGRYDRFEQDIRREYRWVPKALYRRNRREILESFLDRTRIYSTDWFQERYEEQARKNLLFAIEALR